MSNEQGKTLRTTGSKDSSAVADPLPRQDVLPLPGLDHLPLLIASLYRPAMRLLQ